MFLTYSQAITGSDSHKWLQAIDEEKKSLQKNETWEVIDTDKIPKIKPLSSRWIFKIKDDGEYKARLVIRGNEQKYGINYTETFSPVISISAIRALLTLAA